MSDSENDRNPQDGKSPSLDSFAKTTPAPAPADVGDVDANQQTIQIKKTAAAGKKKVSQIGDFKIVRKLGKGGMGEVFLAKQVSLDRTVALKTLSKALSKRTDAVRRFIREARAMAKIDHPNAVRVYAVESRQGLHYAAIEYVDGQSLQDWLNDLQRLSIGDAVHVILRCADALRHAHDLKIIHRDIKPDNILLTQKGLVKLADFGLAKVIDDDVSMTQSGTGMGTPLYMSPEQARNAKHVDQRGDIYALGVTLYHFLTGALPFSGESTVELLMSKEQGRFTPARQLNPDIPERLDLILDKMIARKPEHRYASCGELIRDLNTLGIENPTLSFIAADGKTVITPQLAPTSAGPQVTQRPTADLTRDPVSAGNAATQGASQTAPEKPQVKWFVRYTNTEGKVVVASLTTSQIVKGIKGEMLDLKAKARKSEHGDFLPLSQFPEFESAMKNRLIKAKADVRSQNMQQMYADIDKQERRRHRWRWLKGKFEGVLGMLSLLLLVAVLTAVGYGLFLGLPFLYKMIAEKFNLV